MVQTVLWPADTVTEGRIVTLPAGVYVRGAPADGGGLAVTKVRSSLTYYIAENKHTGILNRHFKQKIVQ